jgi:hypothetical protein
MKKYFFVLFIFAGCGGYRGEDSYFKIDELELVPCHIIDKPNNRLYLYDTGFTAGRDSIRFVFSVTDLHFVDKSGGQCCEMLPAAGHMGIYEPLKSIKVFARNKTMPLYKEVTSELAFDISTRSNPAFFHKGPNSATSSWMYRIFPDFDAFIKEVNKVPATVSGRYWMSSTLKPHIVFSIPRSIISDGNNEIMLTLYAGSDSVSAEARITVNE